MILLPSTINGVDLVLAPTVGREIDDLLLDGLVFCPHENVCFYQRLRSVYVSSAFDSEHCDHSRHYRGLAVDISRLNGVRIGEGTASVVALATAIQQRFDQYVFAYENFGPSLKHKLGQEHYVSGHRDHIHLSVNRPSVPAHPHHHDPPKAAKH